MSFLPDANTGHGVVCLTCARGMDWTDFRFTFHGCQLGLVNRHGQPVLKAWTIAIDMPELSILEDFKCTHEHQHAQNRGRDLKDVENYTYELTDLIHRCFEGSA